jgi:hypothetical protein
VAGGYHHWSVTVTLAGVDVTSRLRGELWRRQELSAAHLCRLRLAPLDPEDWDAEALAATGAALIVQAAWDGAGASVRFSGRVEEVGWDDAAQVMLVEASDGLQDWANAQDEAAIDAAVPGSQRHAEVQEGRRTGWSQLQTCLATVRAGYAIGRDGTHRVIEWAPAITPDLTLGTGDIVWRGARRSASRLSDRVNRVQWTLRLRAPLLYQWTISAGFGLGQTFDQWYLDQWVLPPIERVQSAVESAGAVYRPQGAISALSADYGAGNGISYTYDWATGTYDVGGSPVTHTRDPSVCVAAEWRWLLRSRQLIELEYTLVVEHAGSIAAYGALVDERTATLERLDDYAGWEQSVTGGRPSPEAWETPPGHSAGARWLALDGSEEAAAIAAALAEADATIAGSHRVVLDVGVLPWAGQSIDLHHAIADTAHDWTGRPQWVEERYDFETWAAELRCGLARYETVDGSCVGDELTPPARPTIPADYSLTLDITFPTRLGGESASPAYDGDWQGLTTNYYEVDPEAEVYPYRARFERPAVPAGARDSLTVASETTYQVCLEAA